jgi:hypothetical protein
LSIPSALPVRDRQCSFEEPQLREIADGHFVACHNPVTVKR